MAHGPAFSSTQRSTGNCSRRNSTAATVIRRWARGYPRQWPSGPKGDGKNMDSKVVKISAARPRSRTYYERWIEQEGVPVVEGFGVTDVRKIALKKWQRLGCEGAYLQLRGLEGITGVYLGKIAPGTSLEPERHLYEEVIYILHGEGVAEMQQRDRVPQSIGWQTGSLFSPPLNVLHRLINYSSEPAFFLA